jgi:hypothetical protein
MEHLIVNFFCSSRKNYEKKKHHISLLKSPYINLIHNISKMKYCLSKDHIIDEKKSSAKKKLNKTIATGKKK